MDMFKKLMLPIIGLNLIIPVAVSAETTTLTSLNQSQTPLKVHVISQTGSSWTLLAPGQSMTIKNMPTPVQIGFMYLNDNADYKVVEGYAISGQCHVVNMSNTIQVADKVNQINITNVDAIGRDITVNCK